MRKIGTLLTLLLIFVLTLSGCSFLSIDKVKFYSATVATVDDVNITRQDLLEAYSSYGYENYVSNAGLSVDEALRKTLDNEIQKELLLKYSTRFTLTDNEIGKLWNNVYTYMNNLLNNYKTKAMEDLDMIDPTSPEMTETDLGDWKAEEVYTHRATLTSSLETVVEQNDVEVQKKVYNISLNRDEDTTVYSTIGWEHFVPNFADETLLNKCIEYAVADLIDAEEFERDENGDKLSVVPSEVLERKANKIYDTLYEYAMLNKVQEDYEYNRYYSADLILAKYRELVLDSYLTYNNDETTYNSDMVGDSAAPDTVYYHPNNNYYYLNNLLLGFNEDQQKIITANKELLEKGVGCGGISQEEYDSRLLTLASQIMVDVHDEATGEITGQMKPEDVLKELQQNVVGGKTQRAAAFNEAIYKYNCDPGMFNADMPYIDSEDNSNMVTEFNEAGVVLDEAGIFGGISGLVLTDFGYHILFYAGKVNTSYDNDILNYSNLNNVTIEDLYRTIVNFTTGETLFDQIFDIVYPDSSSSSSNNSYSSYEGRLIDLLEEQYKVVVYSDVLKTSFKLS